MFLSVHGGESWVQTVGVQLAILGMKSVGTSDEVLQWCVGRGIKIALGTRRNIAGGDGAPT